jgi:hypothetical protein
VEDLMSQDWNGIQMGNSTHKAEIIQVGLEHSLATQYTSFVAVEERTVVTDGKPVRIEVPVELPQGVSPLAVPNEQFDRMQTFAQTSLATFAGTRNVTVEVSADAPLIETSSAQVTNTFSGKELNPGAVVAEGPGIFSGIKDHFEEKQKREWETNRKLAQPKFSKELLSRYQCASIGSTPDGKACAPPSSKVVKVKIELTSAGAAVAQKLALAGFKVETGKGSLELTGRILTYRLKQLVQIAEVKSVSLSDQ